VKFISLFAGVGGFDEGMRRAGHECVAMVEWDKAAAGVLSYRYPDVPLYCDVSKVEVDDLPDCDFLTYGFPCQDLSVAGKRKGLEGERSGLFFEATRLIRGLHARGSRFRFAVAENVKGLFSADDGHAFARCIRELRQCGASEIGWSVYDSQYFGLAQRRKRVFIVSDFGGSSCDQVLAITESLHGNTAPKREAGKGAPAGTGSGFTASSYGGYERGCGTLRSEGGDIGGGSETLAVDVYNGEVTGDTAATVTSATGIANASGPKVVGWNGDVTPKSSEDVSVTLRSQQGGEGVGVALGTPWDAQRARIIDENGVAPTLPTGAENSGNTTPAVAQSVAFTASDRSNKAGWTSEVHGSLNCQMQSDTSNLQMGVIQEDNPQMNATLDQEDGKTVEGMCEMRGATMVRRLTPMECERLQGFEDGWTSKRCILELEGNQWKPTGKVEEQKDGPRYRQMGNAVSVPVAEYLGHRMAQAV
jgi:DNA (cytosine-5)-methyltransferase 1